MILVVLALAGGVNCPKVRADFYVPARGEVSAGNRKFSSGRYKEAVDHYAKAALKAPSSAEIAYNTGAALYKNGEYDQAVGYFEKALLTDDDDFRQSVHFNLGNAFYRSALNSEQVDPKVALSGFEQAVSSYESALAIDSEDIQAKTNMEFVRKEIERVRQQQQQQQQQSGNKQDKDSLQKDQQQESREQSGAGQNSSAEEVPSERNQQDEPSGADQSKADASRGEEQKQASSGHQTSGAQQQETQTSGDSDKSSGEQKAENARQLSRQEAEGMLDDLEQSELPRGMLNFIRKSRDHATVQKDW